MKFTRIVALIMCAVMLFSIVGAAVSAVDGGALSLEYNGKNKSFVFKNIEKGGLFEGFENISPGDTLSQGLLIKGKNIKETAHLYLLTEGEELPEGVKIVIFDESKVLYDSSATFRSKILLHSFEKSEDVPLRIVLSVPATIGKEVSGITEKVNWNFVIEEAGIEYKPDVPETGESGELFIYVSLLVICFISLIVIYRGVKHTKTVVPKKANTKKRKK